jgi:hypothetical protein
LNFVTRGNHEQAPEGHDTMAKRRFKDAGRRLGSRAKAGVRLEWRAGEFGQWLGGRDMICAASMPSVEPREADWADLTVTGSQVPPPLLDNG